MLKDKLKFNSKKFTKSDFKIYKWFLEEKEISNINKNIKKASEEIGVSPSALTRFCQKNKLKGWNELIFILEQEKKIKKKKYTNNTFLNNIIFSLSATEKNVKKQTLKKIAQKIIEFDHIYLYGESFTEILAIEFSRKLNKIGISTTVYNVASDLAIIMPKNNSLNLMISMSGMNPNIKLATKKIIKNNSKQIIYSIGATKYSNIEKYSNEFIQGEFYQENIMDPYELPSISKFIVNYILNEIFNLIFNSNKEKYSKLISEIAKEKKH